MGEEQRVTRAEVVVDGEPVILARHQDLPALKRRFEAAVATGGAFVDLDAAGGRSVSVLVTPHTRVVITVRSVQIGETGAFDHGEPFGTLFEFSNDLG